jgi:hypothetical protein
LPIGIHRTPITITCITPLGCIEAINVENSAPSIRTIHASGCSNNRKITIVFELPLLLCAMYQSDLGAD